MPRDPLGSVLINQKSNVCQEICIVLPNKTWHFLGRFISFSIFIALKSDASNIFFQRSKRIEIAWRNRGMGECFSMQYIVLIPISAEGTTSLFFGMFLCFHSKFDRLCFLGKWRTSNVSPSCSKLLLFELFSVCALRSVVLKFFWYTFFWASSLYQLLS